MKSVTVTLICITVLVSCTSKNKDDEVGLDSQTKNILLTAKKESGCTDKEFQEALIRWCKLYTVLGEEFREGRMSEDDFRDLPGKTDELMKLMGEQERVTLR